MNSEKFQWRCCECFYEKNPPADLRCRECNKQRWAQIGLGYMAARGLAQTIHPAIYRTIV